MRLGGYEYDGVVHAIVQRDLVGSGHHYKKFSAWCGFQVTTSEPSTDDATTCVCCLAAEVSGSRGS